MTHPGSALVSTIAKHWNVSLPIAREIISTSGLAPIGAGWARYLWQDIWRFEQEVLVPRHLWTEFKAPLLKISELPEHDPESRALRTLRRHVEKGRIPSIRLSPNVVRVRACVFSIAIHHV